MKKLLFAIFAIIIYSKIQSQIPTNGLIAHYKLNADAVDSSPLSNDGIPINVLGSEDRFGLPNMAYSFNGVNSRIECGTNMLPYKDSITLAAWVKTTDQKYQWIAGKYVFAQDKGFLLYINEGKLRLDGRDSNGTYITNRLSEIEINDGEWHFVAGTIAKNEWAVYVDCEYQGSVFTQNTDVNLQPNIEFNIGNNPRDPGGNKQFFKGAIDDVYLYNRALSEEELLLFITLRNSKSLTLNGKTDFLEIPHNPLLNVPNNLTIECWIKPNCSDGNRMIVSKEWCLDSQFSYYLSIIDEKLAWTFDSDGSCDVPNRYQTSNITVPANQFTHIAMVHSENDIKLYINGKLTTSQYITGVFSDLVDSNEPIRIGTYKGISGNFGNYFSGMVDDLRVWNKALSGQEIASRMNKNLISTETGLLINFDMEDDGFGNGLILKNKSSYGSTFETKTIGFTSNTPFIGTLPFQCEQPKLMFQELIDTCAIEIEILLDVYRYCNIIWNDGISTKTRKISQTGQYSVIVETELCNFLYDTINVQLGEIKNTNISLDICSGESILINSTYYDQDGNYTQTLQATNGCDSVLNISIRLIDVIDSYQEYNLCNDDSITINNITYSEQGVYKQALTTNSGCDSLLIITINVLEESTIYLNYYLCNNETIDLNGITYNMTGTFNQILSNINGCDSIINILIERVDKKTETIEVAFCEHDSVKVNEIFYNNSGIYIQNFISQSLCDSVLEIIVKEVTLPRLFQDTVLCNLVDFKIDKPNGFNVFVTNEENEEISSLMESGTYNVQIEKDGCLKTQTANIHFNQSNFNSIDTSLCQNEEILIGMNPFSNDTVVIYSNLNLSTTCYDTTEYNIKVVIEDLIDFDSITICSNNNLVLNQPVVWEDGIRSNIFKITESKLYIVKDTIQNCLISDSIFIELIDFSMPNIFSPNEDGINDLFCAPEHSDLKILDRWGNLLYSTISIFNNCWNGKFNSTPVVNGVYMYIISTKNDICPIFVGDVTIIR